MKEFIFAVCIYLALHFGFVNVGKVIYNQPVSAGNIFMMMAPITAVILRCLGCW